MNWKNWEQWKIVIAKLSRDAIVIGMFLLLAALLAEALLPGIITQKIPLTLVAFPLFLFLGIYLLFLARWNLEEKTKKPAYAGKIASLIFVIIIAVLASYKFRLWEIAIITITLAAITVLFFKNFSAEE